MKLDLHIIRKWIVRSIVAFVVLFLVLFTNMPYQLLTQRTYENVLIKDKQISTESKKSDGTVASTYLIYTDHGVYRNDDAFWFFKFNSSDFYGNLDVGKHYNLKVYGFRISVFSMYPNIVRMKLVEAPVSTQQPTQP